MKPLVTLVGQGLAGTMLGWELERNGVAFRIIDPGRQDAGPSGCASAVAAGIINPITGQRLVKSWRIEELLPLVRASYRAMEAAWGVAIWRDLRVRRLWRQPHERAVFLVKQSRGELAPFVSEADDDGFWIEGAGQLDVPRLIATARERWRASGHLVEHAWAPTSQRELAEGLTILCTGAAIRSEPRLAKVAWAVAKGELLTLSMEQLVPDVILNRGIWILPLGADIAKAGATYTPGADDLTTTTAARTELERGVNSIRSTAFHVITQEVGLRLMAPDKRPIAGRIPGTDSVGVLGALGSKGALLAPWLARQWWNHLSEGVPFDPAVDVKRYARS